nr:hypothetical protein [Tanacetum cinerariifolium]
MSHALQKLFESYPPQLMLAELKKMFEKPQTVEIYDLVDALHSCKQAPGKSVSAHVLEMKGYMDQLHARGKSYDNDMVFNLINRVRKTRPLHLKYLPTIPKPQANKKDISKGKIDKNKKVVPYQPKPKHNPLKRKENPNKDQTCHHCHVAGHLKRNCPLYLEELRNIRTRLSTVLQLQRFKEERKLSYGEQYLQVGNGAQAAVEAIGVFDLVLPSGLVLKLNNCYYAASIVRGVVFLSCLLDLGFNHTIASNGISVSLNGLFYFSVVSVNGVFEIDMNNNVSKNNNNSIFNINKKRKLDFDSSYLWHCRLAHIGKTRMQKLQREGILESINDESFDKCEFCISGKITKKPFNKNIERATDLLGLIHT